MDKPEDNQPGSGGERLSSLGGENWLWRIQLGALDGGNQATEEKTEEEEVGRLKKLIVELKGNLIVLNRGIVARQDMIDQLTKRKQELLEADKGQATSVGFLTAAVIRTAKVKLDLIDNDVGRDAVEIFPEEVWELVLDKLTDPKDLRNSSKSCQLFDRILHPLKQTFLFIGIFPDLCSYPDNVDILSCRSVCKGWNEGVDSFAENHPARFNPGCAPQTNTGLFLYEFTNDSGDLRELNFFKQMRHHSRNPFVGRAVNIRIDQHYVGPCYFSDYKSDEEDSDDGDDWEPDPFSDEENSDDEDFWDSDDDSYHFDHLVDRYDHSFGYGSPAPDYLPHDEAIGNSDEQQKQLFWQALLKFLRMFGKHIWHISFQYDREFPFTMSQPSVFRFLTRKIFILAPNLRSLQIKGYLPSASHLILGPLPVAPKLEALQIEREWRLFMVDNPLKSSVTKTLINASFQHLKQLRIDWATWKHIFKFNLDWTRLTELYITNNKPLHGNGGIAKVKHLVPAKVSHLKKIGLKHHPIQSQCNFLKIMKIIIGLSAKTKLQAFRLHYWGIETKEVLHAPIRLFAPPTLKTLEIDRILMTRGDYGFLLRFPFLENLIIFFDRGTYWVRDKKIAERQVLELESYMRQQRVYECDIWELLPRLKSVTVGWEVYTRECYERIMSRKRNSLEQEV